MTRPVVLVSSCNKLIGVHPYHAVQQKYVDAVVKGADCAPLILPSLGDVTDWDAILGAADGVMLTGSPSNVNPSFFGQEVRNPLLPLDAARDATTLPLIRAALARGIPLIAVCRGTQEINVALGGSLYQAIHEVGDYRDHRENFEADLEVQYAPAHAVHIVPNGRLAKILGSADDIMVNSLHGQGVERLAPGLTVEARADDGIVEAFSVTDAKGFSLALQWHPEWRITENPASMKMFGAFGDACRAYRALK
ncbi:MAG: gamma-glutamyl-gamma-aminobutyrate hydrolase family protein [Burkholderiaceae bacterium]|nr:gamma-glutamyl-gamma-aminobutyrate hydrolase family protein [Burkholderiaceae bacterium]